jgi:hypothetical protein
MGAFLYLSGNNMCLFLGKKGGVVYFTGKESMLACISLVERLKGGGWLFYISVLKCSSQN